MYQNFSLKLAKLIPTCIRVKKSSFKHVAVVRQGKCKKMGGSPDGSKKKKVIMDPFAMLVDIGKLGSRANGMNVQIYLVNSMKTLLIP
nr:hypothetical protein CFP56_33393 [Quercus suber]